jgi:hypothetical protein
MTPDEAEGWLLDDPSRQTLAWCLMLVDIARTGRRLTAAKYHPDLMEFLTEVQATRLTGEILTMIHEYGDHGDAAKCIKMFRRRRKLVLGEEKKHTKKAAKKANVLQLVPKPKAG